MKKEKINVGIVGLGFMAATHIKAYRQLPSARITAICNPSGRNLDGDLTKVGGNIGSNDPVKLDMSKVKATRNFEDLISDPSIQLIDVCSPTSCHPEHVLRALQAGKHVMVEKPLARNSAAARKIVEAAAKAKTFCIPAMCLRFWPEWAWLKEAVEKHTYGEVLSARFRRVAEPPSWGKKHFPVGAQSGGALLDLHIHDVDFVQYLFGRPHAVFAMGYTKYTGAIDHVVAQYRINSGAIVQAEGSWAMAPGFGFSMSYTVNFEDATVDYDIARPPAEALKVCRGGKVKYIKCKGADGYVGELRHLLECIQSGIEPSTVRIEDGLLDVEICEAEEESIQTGRVVVLD
jgi:predicted dehydrogenase